MNTRTAVLVSPLVSILIAPFYGFFLAYYYVSFSGSKYELIDLFYGGLVYGVSSAVVGIIVGYVFIFTYGLFVWFIFKKLESHRLWNYILAGCFPGMLYGLTHPVFVESFVPGVLFGCAIASCFWYLAIKPLKFKT